MRRLMSPSPIVTASRGSRWAHVVFPELAVALHIDLWRARVTITYRGHFIRERPMALA